MLTLWQTHYLQRTFVYPFLMRGGGPHPDRPSWRMAIAFNLLNAYVNARWVSHLGRYATDWLVDPRFLAGVTLFAGGLALNLNADRTLRRLRAPGESGYRIPYGGAYRWVSCPNYLGEIVEWFGWALATWSAGRPGVRAVHDREPGPAGGRQPRLVPGAVRRLSRRAAGPRTVPAG